MRFLRATVSLSLCCAAAPWLGAEETGEQFFTGKIAPLLKERCYECHSHEKKIKGGLTLDSKSGWEKGGDSGPAIVPGKPETSLLIKAVSYAEKDLQMPPKKQLQPEETELLKKWVALGAPDPRATPATTTALVAEDTWAAEFQKRLEWWSLKPMQRAEPPVVQDAAWSREPVDRFLRAELAEAKLSPAPPATPEVLLRRLSLVLTGLPPSPADVEAFLRASAANPEAALTALVDRLLASPHYGEHFARRWMDVVRYTDTHGYEWDTPAKGSWEYRDYLIRAFNQDLGFDQLVREQIAGDLLTKPRINRTAGLNESLIGPVFYNLGEHRHGSSLDFNGIHQDMVNNKIDAFSKAFLASTVACARCHDHKLEAVSQRDYYALAAVFTVPRWTARVLDLPGKNDAAIAKLKSLRASIRKELAQKWAACGGSLGATAIRAWAAENRPSWKETKIEEPAYPLARLFDRENDIVAAWNDLAKEWQTAREQRRQANERFSPMPGFRDGQLPKGWVAEGDGLTHGHVPEATPLIALQGTGVLSRLLPRGWHTHALSPKLPGALRTPPETDIPGKILTAQLSAEGFAVALPVPDHAFQNEPFTFIGNAAPEWKSFADAELKNGVRQVTLEFANAPLNPNFPPRTGLAKGMKWQDFGYEPRSGLSITGLVTHEAAGAPQDTLDAFATLYEGAAPQTPAEAWNRVRAWWAGSIDRWCRDQLRDGDRALLDWLLTKKVLPNDMAPGSRLQTLCIAYRRTESSLPFPHTANSMDERETTRAAYPLNVRGNVDSPGQPVAPDFLQMLAGTHRVAESRQSGRLELAESLVQPEHPLTARVYVNRVWQWVFGTGLVATPDDFGRLGEKPSHPELLDWLARQFIQENWSSKQLVRRLVLSQAFRQSSAVTPTAREHDPANRLLHHYPTRRLEAEAIRDSLLAVAGRLDPQLHGHPILPPRTVEDGLKRLYSGPLDGHGRRSIYLQMSIMSPPKFLVGFNLPDLKLPTGKRDVTNVPSQALAMLNDPFVHAMAKHWVTKLVEQNQDADAASRVRRMFLQALSRSPTEAETKRWLAALTDLASKPDADLLRDEPAWQRLAHAFFNTKEFLYYR